MSGVSVIIPTYNRAGYLREALASVIGQSLAPTEVIVVDDGSTDDTQSLVGELAPTVRYLRQDHRGVAAARNLGLAAASGDLIAWLDSDDLWEPGFLATLVPLLSDDPQLDGAYCGISHINAAGGRLPMDSLRIVPPESLYSALIEADFVTTPAIMVRKRCYDAVGDFDPTFSICEDYDMWLRLARQFRIAGVPSPLVRIRVHTDSTSMRSVNTFRIYRLALIRKHFGEPDGDSARWPEDKQRAYAYAYLECGLRYLETPQVAEGWRCLASAVASWPRLLLRPDLFYELACIGSGRGERGVATRIDFVARKAEILIWLDDVSHSPDPRVAPMRGKAYGAVHLALAMLADQAGRWGLARGYLAAAFVSDPSLLANPSVVRRMLKLCAGRHLVTWLRGRRAYCFEQ